MARRPKDTTGTARRSKDTAAKAAARKGTKGKSAPTPLEYMLQVLGDPRSTRDEKKWAAQQAAPYMHARLAPAKTGGPGAGPVPHDHTLDPAVQDMIDRVVRRNPA